METFLGLVLPPKREESLVGKVVSFAERMRLGVVVGEYKVGVKSFVVCHYLGEDGGLLSCPDKTRCQHRTTCPIHGCTVLRSAVQVMSHNDLAFYVEEGVVSPTIARQHVKS